MTMMIMTRLICEFDCGYSAQPVHVPERIKGELKAEIFILFAFIYSFLKRNKIKSRYFFSFNSCYLREN